MSPLTTLRFGLPFGRKCVAEVHDVVDGDLVAEVEQLGRQQAADVAGAAGDENVLEHDVIR